MTPVERTSTAARLPYPPELDEPHVLADRMIPQMPTEPATLAMPAQRVASIDLLRIVAAVGIVWFHTDGAPYSQIGYAGLPVFLLIYFSLITKQSGVHTTREFLQRRWDRLLQPWLFWWVVYGLGKVVKAAYTMDLSPVERMLSLETFLAGTCIHLWYLPYAFASGFLLYQLNRRIAKANDTLVIFAATAVGILTLAACTVSMQAFRLAPPWPQWEFGLAAIPLGLAVGRSLAAPSRRVQMERLAVISAVTMGVSLVLVSRVPYSAAFPYSLALVLVCLAYGCPISSNGFIAAAAPLTLGIYLLHPLVIVGLTRFLPASGNYPAFILLAALISATVTWALMQTPLRRFV